jgi:hypothetical protein
MKVAIVGNCQARPIANILKVRMSSAEMIGTIIVHLSKSSEHCAHYSMLDQADIIFSQLVSDSYHVSHVITNNLRSQFGDRVISWPNIFFRGQCPDLVYARSTSGQNILTPLREYSLLRILSSWEMGQSVEECLRSLGEDNATQAREFSEISRVSLQALRHREANLDTKISDVIEEQKHERRLFFTFNHPTSFLLTKMAERLLGRVGLSFDAEMSKQLREPLDLVVGPTLPVERSALCLPREMGPECVGAEIIVSETGVTLGARRAYTLAQLVEASFSSYDLQVDRAAGTSFSPR